MLERILQVARWWTRRERTRRAEVHPQIVPPTDSLLQQMPAEIIAPTDSLLLQLPAEIVLEIADRLPLENAICLLLTCKALYSILFPACGRSSSATLDSSGSRRALSILLERDLAEKFYVCPICDRLRRIRVDWMISGDFAPGWWKAVIVCVKCGYGQCTPTHIPGPHYHGFDSHLLRLITNRHVYGGEAGLPLSVIEWKTDRSRPYLNAQRGAEHREWRHQFWVSPSSLKANRSLAKA